MTFQLLISHLLVGEGVLGGMSLAQEKNDSGMADRIGVAALAPLHEPRRRPALVPHQEASGKPRVPEVVSWPRE